MDGSFAGNDAMDQPGRWLELDTPSEERLEALRRRLEAGQMPEFVTVKLL